MARNIRELVVELRGAPVAPRISQFTLVTPSQVVLKQNGARIAAHVVNTGGVDFFLIPTEAALAPNANGIRIQAGGGSVSMQWDEDGEIVAHEWVAGSAGGVTGGLAIEEVFLAHPEREP